MCAFCNSQVKIAWIISCLVLIQLLSVVNISAYIPWCTSARIHLHYNPRSEIDGTYRWPYLILQEKFQLLFIVALSITCQHQYMSFLSFTCSEVLVNFCHLRLCKMLCHCSIIIFLITKEVKSHVFYHSYFFSKILFPEICSFLFCFLVQFFT